MDLTVLVGRHQTINPLRQFAVLPWLKFLQEFQEFHNSPESQFQKYPKRNPIDYWVLDIFDKLQRLDVPKAIGFARHHLVLYPNRATALEKLKEQKEDLHVLTNTILISLDIFEINGQLEFSKSALVQNLENAFCSAQTYFEYLYCHFEAIDFSLLGLDAGGCLFEFIDTGPRDSALAFYRNLARSNVLKGIREDIREIAMRTTHDDIRRSALNKIDDLFCLLSSMQNSIASGNLSNYYASRVMFFKQAFDFDQHSRLLPSCLRALLRQCL